MVSHSNDMKNTARYEPLVSVVIPTYNAGLLLSDCIKSLLEQTHKSLELVVVDDGSTDGSIDLIRSLANESRLKIVQVDHSGGPARPRNVGVRKATGDIIMFFDSDDLAKPNKVEETIRAFQSAGADTDFIVTDFEIISEDGSAILCPSYWARFPKLTKLGGGTELAGLPTLKGPEAYGLLLKGNLIGTSSAAVRRSALLEVGDFDESLSNGDDYDMWLRLARKFGLVLLPKVLHSYRRVGGGISSKTALKLAPTRITVLRRQYNSARNAADRKVIDTRIGANLSAMAWESRKAGNFGSASRFYVQAIRLDPRIQHFTALLKCYLAWGASWVRRH